LPELRERAEDVPMLAAQFAAKAAAKNGRAQPELDAELLAALQEYEWPGNVRELEHLMERLVVLTPGTRIGVELLPEKILRFIPKCEASASVEDESTLEGALDAAKRRMILQAIQAEGGNKAAAAKRLGISRSYLHRLLGDLKITLS
jgi:DNA-binding NtrC family response regulator